MHAAQSHDRHQAIWSAAPGHDGMQFNPCNSVTARRPTVHTGVGVIALTTKRYEARLPDREVGDRFRQHRPERASADVGLP